LIFDPKPNQLIFVQDATVTKVGRKTVNRYWRYRGNIQSWMHGQRHACADHIASGPYFVGGGGVINKAIISQANNKSECNDFLKYN